MGAVFNSGPSFPSFIHSLCARVCTYVYVCVCFLFLFVLKLIVFLKYNKDGVKLVYYLFIIICESLWEGTNVSTRNQNRQGVFGTLPLLSVQRQ